MFYYRQPKRRLSDSKRQASLEEKPSLSRRVSSGSEVRGPRPPASSHDRHHQSMVPNRILTSKSSEASGVSRGQFSPSPPTSANQKRLTPSPPTSAKAARPTSAARFRKMVVECRDSGRWLLVKKQSQLNNTWCKRRMVSICVFTFSHEVFSTLRVNLGLCVLGLFVACEVFENWNFKCTSVWGTSSHLGIEDVFGRALVTSKNWHGNRRKITLFILYSTCNVLCVQKKKTLVHNRLLSVLVMN